jgi:hypothetical protein
VLRWGLAVGGYANDPALDQLASPSSLTFLLSNVAQRAFEDRGLGRDLVNRFGLPSGELSADHAARLAGAFLAHFEPSLATAWPNHAAWTDLQRLGLELAEPSTGLQRGEIYALAAWLLERFGRSHPSAHYAASPPSAER